VTRPLHGLRDWLLQRLTAIYLGCYIGFMLVYFISQPQPGYRQWHALMTQPLMSIASAIFILAVLVHGWVGMRDVVLDYVHSLQLRLTVLTAIALVLIATGAGALQILLTTTGQRL